MAERPAPRKSSSSRGKAKASTARGAAKDTSVTGSNAQKTPRMGKRFSPEDRWKMIADVAFFKAERRGFVPGGEIADWLAAEMEVDALLMRKTRETAKGS